MYTRYFWCKNNKTYLKLPPILSPYYLDLGQLSQDQTVLLHFGYAIRYTFAWLRLFADYCFILLYFLSIWTDSLEQSV